jgi:hypothetical protein
MGAICWCAHGDVLCEWAGAEMSCAHGGVLDVQLAWIYKHGLDRRINWNSKCVHHNAVH